MLKITGDYLFLFKDLYILHANLENKLYLDAYKMKIKNYSKIYIQPYIYTISAANALLVRFKQNSVKLKTIKEFSQLYKLKLKIGDDTQSPKKLEKLPVPLGWAKVAQPIPEVWENLLQEELEKLNGHN